MNHPGLLLMSCVVRVRRSVVDDGAAGGEHRGAVCAPSEAAEADRGGVRHAAQLDSASPSLLWGSEHARASGIQLLTHDFSPLGYWREQ